MNGVSPRRPQLEPEPQANGGRTELPQMFGPYLLVERTGSGRDGCGEMFKAIALDRRIFGRVVEVRLVARDIIESSMYAHKLAEEARIASLLDHPSIARVIDFGQVNGTFFVATQHLEGRDVRAVVRELRRMHVHLQPGPVALIIREVARGLETAHGLGDEQGLSYRIVHRHVSPGAIVLLRKGGVKLGSFGVVDDAEAPNGLHARARGLPRRVRYFSPEQARGEPLDGRSDVFSLGVVMWELLTGRRLFAGTTAFECIGNVLHAPIEAPSASRPALSRELDRIVLRALERDRTARYQTAGAMADDLDLFVREHQVRKDAVKYILTTLFGVESPSTAHRPPADGDAETVVAHVAEPAVVPHEEPTVPGRPLDLPGALRPPRGTSAPRLPLPASLRALAPVPTPTPLPEPVPPTLTAAIFAPLRLHLETPEQRWKVGTAVAAVVLVLGMCTAMGVLRGHPRPRRLPEAAAVTAPEMEVVPPTPSALPAPPAVTPVPEIAIRVDTRATALAAAPRETAATRRKPAHRAPVKRRRSR